jgi:hypothetical protein
MRIYLALPFLALAACVPSEPLVSDFNGSSVKLVQDNWAGEGVKNEASDAEALRICRAAGKQRAEFGSSRMINDYQIEHLYLCL